MKVSVFITPEFGPDSWHQTIRGYLFSNFVTNKGLKKCCWVKLVLKPTSQYEVLKWLWNSYKFA